MKLSKMEGLGNDYLYVFGAVTEPEKLSIRLSDRHFGIGSDGLIVITRSDAADFRMRIYNADGSEAKMCGNGIRCAAKFVYDNALTKKTELTFETLSGIRKVNLIFDGEAVVGASVLMGKTTVSEKKPIIVGVETCFSYGVSVGNPHRVTFCRNAEVIPLETVGRQIAEENDVNAEFVSVLGENRLRMRVYERGSGITMACGTGACAAVAAAVRAGLCRCNTDIAVVLDGGELTVRILPNGDAMMTGPARHICICEI